MALKVITLGDQGVFLGGHAVAWPSAPARHLFFLLLGHPAGQSRELLVERLWDAELTPASRANFKVTLHRLKLALGDPQAVSEKEHVYTLHARYAAAADDTQFQAALGLMRRAQHPPERLRHGYRAAMLYAGDYLQAYGERWAEERRDLLRSEYVKLRLELAALHCASLECSAAIRNLGAGLASDLLSSETNHQVLMTCLHTVGRTEDALAHFRHYALFVQREVGDTLSHDTVALADALKRGETHATQQIGGPLPCPRRVLYGLSPRVTGAGEPLDLRAWAGELRRGQALHALATRLYGVRQWPALARQAQVFLEGTAGIQHAALLEASALPTAPQGAPPTLDVLFTRMDWPEAARPALEEAVAAAFHPLTPARREGAIRSRQGWRVGVVPLPGPAGSGLTRATLCLCVPDGPGPDALDAELTAQVTDLLRHVMTLSLWSARTGPKMT